MDRDGLWIIAERGGAPWAPSLLEEGRPFAVSRISKPDRQNSAIHSFLVVDRNVNFHDHRMRYAKCETAGRETQRSVYSSYRSLLLTHTEAHHMWWRPNLLSQCSLNSDACPPDATLATLLIQLLLTDLLEGLEVILDALVEGGQMRLSGSVDRAGFGHRFVHRQIGEEGGSNSQGAQRARGVPGGWME